MFLTRITLHDFKNIREASLEFSPKINCISGSNGAGKTNLLDAVYYLSMTKSFFSPSDQYVYSFGSPEADLCGWYRMDNGTEEKIAASVKKGGEKLFKRGTKAYDRFSEHVGMIPIVMVSPLDSSLVNDSGDERRKYLNFILSQTDREYLAHIQAYNQLLMQRNRLLKSEILPDDLLETMRRWEDVRVRRWLTSAQKETLRDSTRSFHLYRTETDALELVEIEMLSVPAAARGLPTFVFECKGRQVIAFWHQASSGRFAVDLDTVRELQAGNLAYV